MWSLDHIIQGLVAEQLTEKYGTKHNEILYGLVMKMMLLYGLAMKMMPTLWPYHENDATLWPCHEHDANFMALS